MTEEEALRELRAYRSYHERRDEIVLAARAAGFTNYRIVQESGLSKPTVIKIMQAQRERDMAAAKRFAVGDEIRYDGDMPENWARDGEVEAVEDDASGAQVVTVAFDDGHRQDILSTELEHAGTVITPELARSLHEAEFGSDCEAVIARCEDGILRVEPDATAKDMGHEIIAGASMIEEWSDGQQMTDADYQTFARELTQELAGRA